MIEWLKYFFVFFVATFVSVAGILLFLELFSNLFGPVGFMVALISLIAAVTATGFYWDEHK